MDESVERSRVTGAGARLFFPASSGCGSFESEFFASGAIWVGVGAGTVAVQPVQSNTRSQAGWTRATRESRAIARWGCLSCTVALPCDVLIQCVRRYLSHTERVLATKWRGNHRIAASQYKRGAFPTR
jgi:hypothetical protein